MIRMTILKLFPKGFIFLLVLLTINNAVLAEVVPKAKNDQEIVELQPSDFKPAFTQETVLKLNAIVTLSFEAIGEYDDVIKNIRSTVDQANQADASVENKQTAQENVDQLGKLSKRSMDALAKMTQAAKELRSSDELFNPVILHGMINFVEDVEREITAEHSKLSAALNSQLD